MCKNFKNTKFGVEIEFTGITREKAAAAMAGVLGTTYHYTGGAYNAWTCVTGDGIARPRTWKIVSDGSVSLVDSRGASTYNRDYSCEFVSPILTYEDMATLQNILRAFRKAGAKVNHSCGIHIHLDGAPQTLQSIKNWAALVASRNDLFYKALKVDAYRLTYCKKNDEALVQNFKSAKTLADLRAAWYKTYPDPGRGTSTHYHGSRYHFLNLHSFFSGPNGTVEIRGFNSTMHAGELRSYVALALALNEQALTQKCARAAKPQTENEKFAMRTYLNRIGLIGSEFETCREVLTRNLSGCSAWRFGTPR